MYVMCPVSSILTSESGILTRFVALTFHRYDDSVKDINDAAEGPISYLKRADEYFNQPTGIEINTPIHVLHVYRSSVDSRRNVTMGKIHDAQRRQI